MFSISETLTKLARKGRRKAEKGLYMPITRIFGSFYTAKYVEDMYQLDLAPQSPLEPYSYWGFHFHENAIRLHGGTRGRTWVDVLDDV